MAKIIIKDSEISSSAGINIPGNLSIAGDTTIGDLFTDSLTVNASTTFNEDIDAKDVIISSSFKGDGSQLHSITASNISNFTNDVRAQFSAGTNVTISNGIISSTGGGGTPGGTNTTVQFNSGSTFSGSTNLIYNYSTNVLSGTTAQFINITSSRGVFTDNVLIYGTASLDMNPDSAYILYNNSIDKLVAFPGFVISGTAGDASQGTLSMAGNGTATAPLITQLNDTNTGIYFPADNTIAISTNGTERLRITGSGDITTTGVLSGTTAQFTSITGSHAGSGANLTNITASNISNFTNDVRAQFSAGTNITITNGQISSTGGATGSVTTVSVVSANGLAGTVANPTTTPAITLSTSVTGLLKGNGTAISAATAGTDYAPATSGTSILYGNGSGGFSNATVGTSLSFTGGSLTRAALTGDVTASANSNATTIAANAVSNTKLADMATARIKGRVTAGTGDPEDLTGTQATTLLDAFTSTLKGLAPASGGGTTNFLRADGTWNVPINATYVVGPGSAADNAIARFDGTTGKIIQDGSGITLSDTGQFSRAGNISIDAAGSTSDIIITAGDDLLMSCNDIGSLQGANVFVEGTNTSKLQVVNQKVELTNTTIDITAAETGADINIKAADAITNTIGFKSEFKVVDITAGDISTFDYQKIINTVRIRNPDGTAASPSYSFTNATGSGMNWNSADGVLAFSHNASNKFNIGGTAGTSLINGGPWIRWGAGALNTPTYSFHGDSDTGIYSPGLGSVSVVHSGRERRSVSSDTTTTDAVAKTIYTYVTTSNTAYSIMYQCVCRQSTGAVNSYIGNVRAKNVSGTVTAVMSLTSANEENTTPTIGVTTSGTNILFTVTGAASTTFNWFAWLEIISVS